MPSFSKTVKFCLQTNKIFQGASEHMEIFCAVSRVFEYQIIPCLSLGNEQWGMNQRSWLRLEFLNDFLGFH